MTTLNDNLIGRIFHNFLQALQFNFKDVKAHEKILLLHTVFTLAKECKFVS